MNQDPVLEILREIRSKQDLTIEKQDKLEAQIGKIHEDCKKVARTNGAVAGGIAGGLVATGIALIKAKFGF